MKPNRTLLSSNRLYISQQKIFFKCISSFFRPKIGDLVAVEKKDDETWVRGVVVDIKEGKYKCALIDYAEFVEESGVRELPKRFQDVPYFTCCCKSDAESIKSIKAVTTSFEIFISNFIGLF